MILERISTADEIKAPKPAVRAEPVPTTEPIIGVPIDEVISWVESWDTPHELPEPVPRRLG